MFDYRMSRTALILLILCFLFPILNYVSIPLFSGMLVKSVEALQLLLLLFAALFTLFYMRPFDHATPNRQFWLWSMFWWLMLLGRSMSWGRDYFPDVPRPYFRVLSILFIAPVVFMLASSTLRQQIAQKAKQLSLPFWGCVLVIGGLLISDSIEHARQWSIIFIQQAMYKDLLEELYEFPLIIGLFLIAYQLMNQDKQKHSA